MTKNPASNAINLERLVFLKPKEMLEVNIKTDKSVYEPGDKVKLTLSLE